MIRVYFESTAHWYAELVATFESEELYMACLPTLEKLAGDSGMIVTETIDEHDAIIGALLTKRTKWRLKK